MLRLACSVMLHPPWLSCQCSLQWWICILKDRHCDCSARNLPELISLINPPLVNGFHLDGSRGLVKAPRTVSISKGCKRIDQHRKCAHGTRQYASVALPRSDDKSKKQLAAMYHTVQYTARGGKGNRAGAKVGKQPLERWIFQIQQVKV